MNALLITGTDTQVGKTLVATALLTHWQQTYPNTPPGVLSLAHRSHPDTQYYAQHFDLSPEAIAPIPDPADPSTPYSDTPIGPLWQTFNSQLNSRPWVCVEGNGGLGTPLTPDTTLADLAWDWRIPTLLVAAIAPTCINAIVAQVALARQGHCQLCGILLNALTPDAQTHQDHWANPEIIQRLTHIPVLGSLPYLGPLESTAFPSGDLRSKLIFIVDQWEHLPLKLTHAPKQTLS